MKTLLLFSLMLFMVACAPTSEPGRVDAATTPVSTASGTAGTSTTTPAPAPAESTTLPIPASAQRPPAELLVKDGVDYSCSIPSDCAIKDVGNCCGYYPACVNANSPTFPDKVKADCAAGGMAGICGFPSIQSCDCIEGRCAGVTGPEAATLKVD